MKKRSITWALALVAGVAAIAEEVLWTRALLPHLNSSTYAFSVILAVFQVLRLADIYEAIDTLGDTTGSYTETES